MDTTLTQKPQERLVSVILGEVKLVHPDINNPPLGTRRKFGDSKRRHRYSFIRSW